MNIYINNEQKQIDGASKLSEVLAAISINSSKGIAIAVNNQVVPKTEWEQFTVNENDKVTIIKATQGG